MRSSYDSMLNYYTRAIRDVEALIDNPELSIWGKTLGQRLIPSWRARIVELELRIERLRAGAQQEMKQRPVWKKLLRKV